MPIKAAVMGFGQYRTLRPSKRWKSSPISPAWASFAGKNPLERMRTICAAFRNTPALRIWQAVSGKPDVVLLCAPSRKIPEVAGDLLGKGYNTVDSFDIHDRIVDAIGLSETQAVKGKAVAITAAGWDPWHGLRDARPV